MKLASFHSGMVLVHICGGVIHTASSSEDAFFSAKGGTPVLRRFRDAWRVLIGRAQGPTTREIARIRREWVEIQADIAIMLEKLGMWAARQRKREQREVSELQQPTERPVAHGAHPKAALMEKARARGLVRGDPFMGRRARELRGALKPAEENGGDNES